MDYQKKKFLDNTPDQPSQFRTKNWVEIKPILYGYINAYIHANETIATQTWQLELKLQQMPIRK